MKFKLALSFAFLMFCVSAISAQTELTIRKKMSIKVAGMPEMAALPDGFADPFKGRSTVTYIKGSRMRTDTRRESRKMFGGKELITDSTIVQCDKRRSVTFNSKKKKYFQESLSPQNTAANIKDTKKGGYITITGGVTDTGERAKLFGYDARHYKEKYTMTPSKNACQRETMTIEIEGWYADAPEFSCPTQRKPREFQMEEDCFDEVDFQVKGNGITGIPLREIKKISIGGQTMIIEEEAISITRDAIADSMFEPPANYRAANTLKEVQDDSPDEANDATAPTPDVPPAPQTANDTPTFAVPKAGVERVVGPKAPGIIRIGVAKPKITTPDTKKDPESGFDIAFATTNSLIESLKAQNVEAIELKTDSPENEAAEKSCDYIMFANVTQKRDGGFGFGKMIALGAISSVGGMVPGVGGMVASTVASQVMGTAMMKNAKAKDAFTLDYKVVGLDKSILAQAMSKAKTEKDGDDVLTPQIQQASKNVLGKINK